MFLTTGGNETIENSIFPGIRFNRETQLLVAKIILVVTINISNYLKNTFSTAMPAHTTFMTNLELECALE